MIKQRKLKITEVTEAFIAQIQRVNPLLNAMVAERFHAARDEARSLEALLERTFATGGQAAVDRLPAYFGVPITVKEVFEVPDMPWSAGLYQRRNIRGKTPSPVVERLQQQGLIILGVGNISEACMWMESSNKIYGRTNNPYDLNRTVGGSSGGDVAMVSACGAPFCIGSDVGGSIRIPAFFNGLYGHKPTSGSVPNSQTQPVCTGDIQLYCQLGPIARHPQDLMPLLKIIAGPHEGDDRCRVIDFGDPDTVDVSKIRFLNCFGDAHHSNPFVSPRNPELVAAQRQVVHHLASIGCTVEAVDFDLMSKAFDIWSSFMSEGQAIPFRELISEGKQQISVFAELIKLAFGASEHTLPALALAAFERIPEAMPQHAKDLVQKGLKLKAELETALADQSGRHTVLVYPTLPDPAPLHHRLLGKFWDSSFTSVFNVMQLPVTAVPLGLSSIGLPLGVQLVGAPGKDHVTIAVASHLHTVFGGWKAPPPPESL